MTSKWVSATSSILAGHAEALRRALQAVRQAPAFDERSIGRRALHVWSRHATGSHSPLHSSSGRRAFRQMNAGAAALSLSVLADSLTEHYRGGFYNPVMYVAPATSAGVLATSAAAAAGKPRRTRLRETVFTAATGTGLVGLGFHLYNILRRIGGVSWENLFYGAPLAAPSGITVAGLFGLAASRALAGRKPRGTLLGRPAGPLITTGSAVALLGTAAEAGLLHFRGAFHDRYMFLPVTIPPLAAVALAAATVRPSRGLPRASRALLGSTTALGLSGVGFHIYGVHRNMGGWYNWSQNVQAGPPIPAPPSFTGIALAGLAGLSLLEGHTAGGPQ